MRFLSRRVVLVFAQIVAASCASVPVPATKAANSPANPEAVESRLEPLGLFQESTASNASTPTTSPTPAAPALDHPMPPVEGGTKGATQSPQTSGADTLEKPFTCVMHPQIMESKPGKCPICGMPLVKKERRKE